MRFRSRARKRKSQGHLGMMDGRRLESRQRLCAQLACAHEDALLNTWVIIIFYDDIFFRERKKISLGCSLLFVCLLFTRRLSQATWSRTALQA